MKTLELDLDLSLIKTNEVLTNQSVWEGFIIQGARSAFKDGVDLKMQSKLLKIIDKINSANGSVELEDAEFEVIKDIKDKSKFDVSYFRIGSQIMEKIQEVK